MPVSGEPGLILSFAGGSSTFPESRAASATTYGTARPGLASDAEPGLLFANEPADAPGRPQLAASSPSQHALNSRAAVIVLSRSGPEFHP